MVRALPISLPLLLVYRQLEVVWPEYKQMKLLDSLWRNYYVPPIVFAVFLDDEGEEIRCCVDGKQRLTSIQKFFDGQVSTHSQFDYAPPQTVHSPHNKPSVV